VPLFSCGANPRASINAMMPPTKQNRLTANARSTFFESCFGNLFRRFDHLLAVFEQVTSWHCAILLD
jgi:hypothetical protein